MRLTVTTVLASADINKVYKCLAEANRVIQSNLEDKALEVTSLKEVIPYQMSKYFQALAEGGTKIPL